MHWPLERQGSTGENVRSVQYLLDAHGASLAVDGIFGPLTAAAVSAFQNANGLLADGIVGGQTWPALVVDVAAPSSGDAVRAVQSQIEARSGWLTVSGAYDAATESAVKFFQGDIGLTVDGIVGLHTWHALVSGYLTSQGDRAGQDFYDAWTHDDRHAAAKNGTPQAVAALFARQWHSSDGWTFTGSGVAAGSFYCAWTRPGETLTLHGNDDTGEPFYFILGVAFGA
jgi:peptidoglycan hydrolase-like protein with peptidoglycan-binding domain